MRERGFLDDELKVQDLISRKAEKKLIAVEPQMTVKEVFNIMKENDISQMPVLKDNQIIGSVSETKILSYLLENPLVHSEDKIELIMDAPFPVVKNDLPYTQLNKYFSQKIQAVITKDMSGAWHIITPYDVIQAI